MCVCGGGVGRGEEQEIIASKKEEMKDEAQDAEQKDEELRQTDLLETLQDRIPNASKKLTVQKINSQPDSRTY